MHSTRTGAAEPKPNCYSDRRPERPLAPVLPAAPRPPRCPLHTPASARAYRHDLDGLRGLAIALVVLFHVFGGSVSGGVDVFVLLSVFFLLGSQIRNADRPGQSIHPLH